MDTTELSLMFWWVHPAFVVRLLNTRKRHHAGSSAGTGEGVIGGDPSVCKSNRLHVHILRFSFIELEYIL